LENTTPQCKAMKVNRKQMNSLKNLFAWKIAISSWFSYNID